MPGEGDKLSSAHLGVDRQIAEEKASLAFLRLRLLFLLTTRIDALDQSAKDSRERSLRLASMDPQLSTVNVAPVGTHLPWSANRQYSVKASAALMQSSVHCHCATDVLIRCLAHIHAF